MNTTKNDPTRKIGYRWVVWVIAILATAVPWYLHSAWSIIGIPIQEQLHLHLSQYGILGSIIMLGPAIFSIPVGNLNNRYGSKPLVCTGMVIILAGILFMTRAQSFPTLIASRLIQGLGFALVWTPSQTLSAKWFTRDEISTASGGYITALSLAFGVAALLAGSPLADKIGRRHHQVRICALILALTYAIVGFAPTPLVATISAVIAGTIAYYWNAPYVGLLGTIAPSDKFEIVMGTNNCFAAAGAVVLPYLMGFLTGDGSLANLRFAFIILLILGLIMFGLGFFLHDPVSRKKS